MSKKVYNVQWLLIALILGGLAWVHFSGGGS
jgi:hypothetical protein